jgi:hypothetical protein
MFCSNGTAVLRPPVGAFAAMMVVACPSPPLHNNSLTSHNRSSPRPSKLPRMQLERQFAGPLQDTVIQRLRDPVDGTVCYLYLPISAPHSPVTATGFVQYGPNVIGSINCMPGAPAAAPGRKP